MKRTSLGWLLLEELTDAGARLTAHRLLDGQRRTLFESALAYPLNAALNPHRNRVALNVLTQGAGGERARIGLLDLTCAGLGWLRQSLDARWRLGRAVFDESGERLAFEGRFGGAPRPDVVVASLAPVRREAARQPLQRDALLGSAQGDGLSCFGPQFLGDGIAYFQERLDGQLEVRLAGLDGLIPVSPKELPPPLVSKVIACERDVLPALGLTAIGERLIFAQRVQGGLRQALRSVDAQGQIREVGRAHLMLESVCPALGGELLAYAADGGLWLVDCESGQTLPLLKPEPGASHRGLCFDLTAGRLLFVTHDGHRTSLRAVNLTNQDVEIVAELPSLVFRTIGLHQEPGLDDYLLSWAKTEALGGLKRRHATSVANDVSSQTNTTPDKALALLDQASSSINQPSTSTDEPSTSTDEPSTSTDEPSTSADEPSISADEPSISADEPSTSTDEPSTSTDEPSTSTDEPSTSTDEPSIPADEPSIPTNEPLISTDAPKPAEEAVDDELKPIDEVSVPADEAPRPILETPKGADLAGWWANLLCATAPEDELLKLIPQRNDPAFRTAAETLLCEQLESPEPASLWAMAGLAYLDLKAASPLLGRLCTTALQKMGDEGIPELPEFMALAVLEFLELSYPFDMVDVFGQYEQSLTDLVTTLETAGDVQAAQKMSQLRAEYHKRLEVLGIAPRVRQSKETISQEPHIPTQTLTFPGVRPDLTVKAPSAEALGEVKPAPRTEPLPQLRTESLADTRDPWTTAVERVRSQAPAALIITSGPTPAPPLVSPAPPDPWAAAKARSQAPLAQPDPWAAATEKARSQAPLAQPDPWVAATEKARSQAPSGVAPASVDERPLRRSRELAAFEAPTDEEPLALVEPPPKLLGVLGLLCCALGLVELLSAAKLGVGLAFLGLLSVVGGVGLISERRQGWFLGQLGLVANGVGLLLFAGSSPPSWLPRSLPVVGALGCLLLSLALLHPALRARLRAP